ncbi:S41 family peptidase [Flavobacterium taihuense]|uniref:Peptidase S41 n=1 Tax=Flavobacterium taihuense TaxID=2857508 RepID=A0ABS6XSV8_9FLAO|nr:S41 family peptidase [Flavobacterium taihuense]MBW4359326.1 peptidase S41 [Flavobacterium taihuense]
MKKITLLLFLVLSQTLFAEVKLTENQKLASTCKVWGFLKYYHPQVASGKMDWDKQLFEVLPKIERANTKEEFSLVLEKWIDGLGEVPVNKPLALDPTTDFFVKNLNLDWTKKNKLFSKNLSQKLEFITENRFQGKNYYVNLDGGSVPLQFTNEVVYPDFPWTDKNLRILALFRFWNYVEYFFPYKYVMDQNWDEALVEILSPIYAPDSEKDFLLAMRELSIKLNDTHAATFNMKMLEYLGGEKYIAAGAKIIDKKAIITSLANDSLAKIDDIKIGDIVTKINGKTVAETLEYLGKYMEGSNKSAALPASGWVMFNGNTDDLEIEFIRDNTIAVKKIHRYSNKDIKRSPPKITPKWKLLENNIGYVDMSKVETEDVKSMMEELKNTQAIIFDDRRRPMYTNFLINDYLNPEPKEIARNLFQDLSFPGRYIWRKDMQTCGKINSDYYKGKVIVLVGAGTFSHGEHTAMAFQTAPNTTIIGSQTAGADGPNYYFSIIKGYDSSFTSGGIFYPNKKETQRIGIIPDIEIKPTIGGIQQGKDEVLDRAVLFAKGEK